MDANVKSMVEDARMYQAALEHERRAINESTDTLVLDEAQEGRHHHLTGITASWARWALSRLGR